MWYNMYMGIGQTVKTLRQQQRLTQGQLEIKSGVKRSTIAMIEQEKRENPTVDTLVKLAVALGVTPDDIIHRAGILPPLPPSVADEGELLRLYRRLDDTQRQTVLVLVRVLSGQPTRPTYLPDEWDDEGLPDELLEEGPTLTERELIAQGGGVPMTDDQWRETMRRFNEIWDRATPTMRPAIAQRIENMTRYFADIREKCGEQE